MARLELIGEWPLLADMYLISMLLRWPITSVNKEDGQHGRTVLDLQSRKSNEGVRVQQS